MYIINNISKSKFAVVVEKHDDHLQFICSSVIQSPPVNIRLI